MMWRQKTDFCRHNILFNRIITALQSKIRNFAIGKKK